jgi:hypothetical protein
LLVHCYRGHYQPGTKINDDACGAIGGIIGKGNGITRRKHAPVPALSATNPTRPDQGWSPGRRDGKQATNRLSYNTAYDFHVVTMLIEKKGTSKYKANIQI